MPVYSIQTPSGKTLDIEASNEQGALAGAQAWHAENAPRQTFGDAFKGLPQPNNAMMAATRTAADKKLVGEGSAMATGINSMANTMLLGAPQAMAAGIETIINGGSYTDNHQRYKDVAEANNRLHPVANGVGIGAGIVGQAATLPFSAPETILARLAAGAGTGAAMGGVEGLITNDGDVSQATKDAGFGALGGLVGGAAFEGGSALFKGGKNLASSIANTFGNAEKRAPKVFNQSLAGADPADIRAYLAANPDAVIADAGGKKARDLLRTSTNASPGGHQLATNMLGERAAQESQTLQDLVGNTLGGGQSKMQATQGLKNSNRAGTTDLYQQAYSEAPNVWDHELEGFANSDIGQKAIKDAFGNAQADYAAQTLRGVKMERPQNAFETNFNGTEARLSRKNPVGLEFWDKTKQALDGMHSIAERGGDYNQARQIDNVRKALIEKLDTVSPSYAEARNAAKTTFQGMDAIDAGAKSLSSGADPRDVTSYFSNLSPENLAQAKTGQGSELQKRLINNAKTPRDGSTYSLANSIFKPEMQRRAELGLNDVTKADLQKGLDFWRRAGETRAALSGSPTARNLAQAGLLGMVGGGGLGMLDPSYSTTGTGALLGGLLAGGGRAFTAKQKAAMGSELTKILLSRNLPQQIAEKHVPKGLLDMIYRSAISAPSRYQSQ